MRNLYGAKKSFLKDMESDTSANKKKDFGCYNPIKHGKHIETSSKMNVRPCLKKSANHKKEATQKMSLI
jgi:hypothetical protein